MNALQIICPSCKIPMEFIKDEATRNLTAVCDCGSEYPIYEPSVGYREIQSEFEKMNYEKYTFDELKLELGRLGISLCHAAEENDNVEILKLAREISKIVQMIDNKPAGEK